MEKELREKFERKAAKEHRCCNCACKIHKGHLYIDEPIYVKASYDSEFEIHSNGRTEHWRTHLSSSECDLALKIEVGDWLK